MVMCWLMVVFIKKACRDIQFQTSIRLASHSVRATISKVQTFQLWYKVFVKYPREFSANNFSRFGSRFHRLLQRVAPPSIVYCAENLDFFTVRSTPRSKRYLEVQLSVVSDEIDSKFC
jgi:hypothetical protein